MNFNKLKIAILGIFCIFLPMQVIADPIDIRTIQPMIARYMSEYKVPGAEVIIQLNGENHLYSFGYADAKKKNPVTPQTLFELGSITKTFTGLILAEQALNGNMQLNDSISPYVAKNASPSIKNLTLLDLATHTSGLPYSVSKLPYNAPLGSKYEDVYTDFLQKWKATNALHTGLMYSNIGFSLLADVLRTHAHASLSLLMQTDIFQPLAMDSSMLTVPNNWKTFYAQGYTSKDVPSRTPNIGLLGGSWAIKSSGQDMSYYLNAATGNQSAPTSIIAAIKIAQTGYFQCLNDKTELGLGWFITPLDKDTVYEKLLHAPVHYNLTVSVPVRKIENPEYNPRALIDKIGATDGFRSYIGVIPEEKIGIVILTNKFTQNSGAIQNLGRKILFTLLKKEV